MKFWHILCSFERGLIKQIRDKTPFAVTQASEGLTFAGVLHSIMEATLTADIAVSYF